MANIGTAAGDITYATVNRWVTAPGRTRRMVQVQFPIGANVTYPAGGIPLDKGMLGVPHVCQHVAVVGQTPVAGNSNPTYIWNGDPMLPKLVALVTAVAGSAGAEFTGSVAAGQSLIVDVEGS
jgi:hypothetical protein